MASAAAGITVLGGPAAVPSSTGAPLSRAAKRAQQEWQQLREAPEEDFEAKPVEEGRLLSWEVLIHGPKHSPYEGGAYCLDLELSESYPFKAPQFSFLTPIYHCNLSLAIAPQRRSAEALLTAKENWHPKIDIRTILRRIHTLMKEPIAGTDLSEEELEALKGDTSKIRLENSLIDTEMAALLRKDPTAYRAKALEATQAFFAPVEVAAAPSEEDHPESSSAAAAAAASSSRATQEDFAVSPCETASSVEDVRLPCPICGTWYTSAILGIHLEGHFAFEAASKLSALHPEDSCAAAAASSSSSAAAAAAASSPSCAPAAAAAPTTSEAAGVDDLDEWEDLGAEEDFFLVDSADVGFDEEESGAEDVGAAGEGEAEEAGAEVESDAAMAARLQQEELDRTLETFSQLAADRLEALRLDESGFGKQASAAQQVAVAQQRERTEATQGAHRIGKAARRQAARAAEQTAKSQPTAKPKAAPAAPASAPARVLRGGPVSTVKQVKTQLTSTVGQVSRIVHPLPEEAALMKFANGEHSKSSLLDQTSEEYCLAKRYFLSTLGAKGVDIQSIQSVNPHGAAKDKFRGSYRLMFHGCKTMHNEAAILSNGFQVSKCISGGRNYGTWFAFNSAYSDSGFAFNDAAGWRHMFICVVANYGVVMENPTMRVVQQGCAYPRWIVLYRHQTSASLHTFNVGPYGRWGGNGQTGRAAALGVAPYGWAVQNGQWVPLTAPQSSKG